MVLVAVAVTIAAVTVVAVVLTVIASEPLCDAGNTLLNPASVYCSTGVAVTAALVDDKKDTLWSRTGSSRVRGRKVSVNYLYFEQPLLWFLGAWRSACRAGAAATAALVDDKKDDQCN